MTALERVERHIEDGQVIRHEEGVEFAAFERLREAFEMREVEIGIRKSAGIAPGASMDGGRPHEGAEPELTRWRHRQPLRKGCSYIGASSFQGNRRVAGIAGENFCGRTAAAAGEAWRCATGVAAINQILRCGSRA